MELLNQIFDEIKESNNPEVINDFLIELSENPNTDHIKYLSYFINNQDIKIFDKIKLNLIYVLGEIGNLTPLSDKYLVFLEKEYYKSDRWVRNEIIQAIFKISKNLDLGEKIIELIANALNDEYSVIKINTLKLISNFKNLPDIILKNLVLLMNSKDPEILDGCRRILKRIPQKTETIFNTLNKSNTYKILKPRGIRTFLLLQFKSINNTESFKEMIINSNWDDNYKENYLKELYTFERILARNL
ncbi:MAG: hypothetical protein ACFE94_05950 [Candidatus Hodarchaeota archaeon]